MGVFDDPNAAEFIDEEHSTNNEVRYIRIGLSSHGLLLFVVFTEPKKDVVRIIHARQATEQWMVKLYEEEGYKQ